MKDNVDLTVDRDFRDKHRMPIYRKRIPWRHDIEYTYYGSGSFTPVIFENVTLPNITWDMEDMWTVNIDNTFTVPITSSSIASNYVKDSRVPWRIKRRTDLIKDTYRWNNDQSLYDLDVYSENGIYIDSKFVRRTNVTLNGRKSDIIQRKKNTKHRDETYNIRQDFIKSSPFKTLFSTSGRTLSDEIMREFRHGCTMLHTNRYKDIRLFIGYGGRGNRYYRHMTDIILHRFKRSLDNLNTNIVERDTRW